MNHFWLSRQISTACKAICRRITIADRIRYISLATLAIPAFKQTKTMKQTSENETKQKRMNQWWIQCNWMDAQADNLEKKNMKSIENSRTDLLDEVPFKMHTLATLSDVDMFVYCWQALVRRHATEPHWTGLPDEVILIVEIPSPIASDALHRRTFVSHAAFGKHLVENWDSIITDFLIVW